MGKDSSSIMSKDFKRCGWHSSRYQLAKLWNEMPSHSKEAISLHNFKSLLSKWAGFKCHYDSCCLCKVYDSWYSWVIHEILRFYINYLHICLVKLTNISFSLSGIFCLNFLMCVFNRFSFHQPTVYNHPSPIIPAPNSLFAVFVCSEHDSK